MGALDVGWRSWKIALVWLCALFMATTARAQPVDDGSDPEGRIGLLAAPALDQAALRDALTLRVPALELRTEWTASPTGAVFISVRPTADGTAVRTELIDGEGHGYVRTLDSSPDDVRGIASVLANLLFSIEEHAVVADVEHIEAPRTSDEAEVERVVATIERELAPEPEPEPETPREPKSPPRLEETDRRAERDPPATPPKPGWDAVAIAGVGAVVPLGAPRWGSLLQGGGVEVGAAAWHSKGARLGLRLRYVGREQVGFRMSRIRAALGGGYGWSVGRLDLPIRGELAVEPWWVSFEGERLRPSQIDAPVGGTIALGGAVRFEPAVVVPVDAGPLATVQVGVSLAVSGSFVVDAGPKVATVVSGVERSLDQPLFRVGGAELWAGAQLGLRWGGR